MIFYILVKDPCGLWIPKKAFEQILEIYCIFLTAKVAVQQSLMKYVCLCVSVCVTLEILLLAANQSIDSRMTPGWLQDDTGGGGQTLDNLVTLISALLSLTASHWSHLGPRRPVRGLYIFSCPVRASDWILLAPMLQCSNAPMLQCSNAPMHLTRCTSYL